MLLEPGSIVWAKFDKSPHWPARIVTAEEMRSFEIKTVKDQGGICVVWLGEDSFGFASPANIVLWDEGDARGWCTYRFSAWPIYEKAIIEGGIAARNAAATVSAGAAAPLDSIGFQIAGGYPF